jgi:hypothetical protein
MNKAKQKIVTIRYDVVEKELANNGWMIAVSNYISEPK